MLTERNAKKHDRRIGERRELIVPVGLESRARHERVGVTHNLSSSGALVLSNSCFEVGETLDLTLFVSESEENAARISGDVVRVMKLGNDVTWRYAMAIEFEEPLAESLSTWSM